MSGSPAQTGVGGAVFIVATGFLFLATPATAFEYSPSSSDLTASFRSVDIKSVGPNVRPAEMKIGTVTKMALNAQTVFADAGLTIAGPDNGAFSTASEGLLRGATVAVSGKSLLMKFDSGWGEV